MARKKLPKDADFAAGFFSKSIESDENEKISAPNLNENRTQKPKKKLGGRPKKEGLKNEQFSLTMEPVLYEKLKVVAKNYTRGNFSALINAAINVFCEQNNIDLGDIEVDEERIKYYIKKQSAKK